MKTNPRHHAVVFAGLLLGVFTTAGAQQASTPIAFYGIELGKPLAIQECATRKFLGETQYEIGSPKNGHCYERAGRGLAGSGTPVGDEVLSVKWPLLRGPQVSKFGQVAVRTIGGLVQRIWVYTTGLSSQDKAYEQLVAKFGQPKEFSKMPVQTRMGAKFEAIVADWQLGEVTVFLAGATSAIDQGEIVVETKAGREAHKAALDAIAGPKPKM